MRTEPAALGKGWPGAAAQLAAAQLKEMPVMKVLSLPNIAL